MQPESLYPDAPRASSSTELELGRLVAACGSAREAEARTDALVALMAYVRANSGMGAGSHDAHTHLPPHRWSRIEALASLLERDAEAASTLRTAIAEMLAHGDALPLFAEAGLGTDRGLYQETMDHLLRRILPAPREDRDLSRCIERCFPGRLGTQWIAELPMPIFERLARAIDLAHADLTTLTIGHAEALALLAARLQALGLSEELRARRTDRSVRASPWSRLPRATERLLAQLAAPEPAPDPAHPEETPRVWAERTWRADARECREADALVLARLESTGVSLDLVYTIDLSARILERMEMLLAPGLAPTRAERIVHVRALLAALASAREADTSLRRLAKDTVRLLARKIVERAGESGEHYIATDRKSYVRMWGSALIGGLVTTFTVAVKLAISVVQLVPFVEGFCSGLNYTLSFLAIHGLGGTLATKQPAMTAASLSGSLLRGRTGAGSTELALHFARIFRSQLAAALGNVIAVGAGAFAFDWVWRAWRGAPYLDPERAEYALHALDPFATLTVLYAAETGVILWLSSVLAGSFANWTVYHRLARGIADHRVGSIVGQERLARFAQRFERQVSTWAGCVFLGFLLGMTPILGRFFGLPFDVRHVTLSTGQLALGAFALDAGPLDPRVIRAALGVATMFVLNLTVSFGLALTLAARARGVDRRERRALLLAALAHLRRQPLDFVRPPADTSGR